MVRQVIEQHTAARCNDQQTLPRRVPNGTELSCAKSTAYLSGQGSRFPSHPSVKGVLKNKPASQQIPLINRGDLLKSQCRVCRMPRTKNDYNKKWCIGASEVVVHCACLHVCMSIGVVHPPPATRRAVPAYDYVSGQPTQPTHPRTVRAATTQKHPFFLHILIIGWVRLSCAGYAFVCCIRHIILGTKKLLRMTVLYFRKYKKSHGGTAPPHCFLTVCCPFTNAPSPQHSPDAWGAHVDARHHVAAVFPCVNVGVLVMCCCGCSCCVTEDDGHGLCKPNIAHQYALGNQIPITFAHCDVIAPTQGWLGATQRRGCLCDV